MSEPVILETEPEVNGEVIDESIITVHTQPKEYRPQAAPVKAVVPESQDIFIDFRDLNWYTFIDDIYTGNGGVSGKTGSASKNITTLNTLNNNKISDEVVYNYLPPNSTECFYLQRIRNTHYINYFERYINTQYKGVYKTPPITTVTVGNKTMVDHPYLDFVRNTNYADMYGSKISKNEFQQNMFNNTYKDGVSFVVMDKDEGTTQPYSYIQTASTVEQYDVDLKGNLISITFINTLPNGKYVKNDWSTNEVIISTSEDNKKWIVQDQKTINRLPILAVFAEARTDKYNYLPKPGSYSIAEMCQSIYESWSMACWIALKQGHDFMYVIGEIDGIRDGLTNVMQLDNLGGTASAGLLSPDANKITVHLALIAQKTQEMFELMLNGGVMASRNGNAPESGIAKMFTFQPLNDALLHTTMIAKSVDQWMVDQYKEYMGGTFEANTEYKQDFAPVLDHSIFDLKEMTTFFEERGLESNSKEILKRMINNIHNNEKLVTAELIAELETKYNVAEDDGIGYKQSTIYTKGTE